MRHFLALRATGAPHEGQARSAPAAAAIEAASGGALRLRRPEDGNSAPHMRHFLALRLTGAPHAGHVRLAPAVAATRIASAAFVLRLAGGGSFAPHIRQVRADCDTSAPQAGQRRGPRLRNDRKRLLIPVSLLVPTHQRCFASPPARRQCARSTRSPDLRRLPRCRPG